MTTQIITKNWLSWDFKVEDGSCAVADVALSSWCDKGELTVDGATYTIDRAAPLSRAFVLEGTDGVFARAEKASVFCQTWVIRYAGHDYTLRRRSIFRRAFVLLDGSREVGSIVPDGIFTRKATVDFSPDLALPLRLFIVWLTVMTWRQEAAAVSYY